jgi:hypothetical protein
MTTKTMEWTCEVNSFGKRKTLTIEEASALHHTREKFCSYCGDRVWAHRAGVNGMVAHFEHFEGQGKVCIFFPLGRQSGENQ